MIIRAKQKHLLIKLFCIVVGFTISVSVAYVWLLPQFFNGYKTYSILILGVLGAAIIASYETYKWGNEQSGISTRIILSTISGLAVAVLIVYFSLLIMLNIGGS
jgi:hypothetical protein